ncbi:MAG: ribosome-associated translation inhibitor RaiA [bacterium]
MEVVIKGKNLEVTDALKGYIRQKISKIEKYIDKITEVDIVLSIERYEHVAEITITAKGIKLHGKEKTSDMYLSIDKVMSKIDRQLKKQKEIITNHKQPGLKDIFMEAEEGVEEEGGDFYDKN